MNHTYIFLALISATAITQAASSDGGPAKTPEQRIDKLEALVAVQAVSLEKLQGMVQQRRASQEKPKSETDLKAAAAQEQQQASDEPSAQKTEEAQLQSLSFEILMAEEAVCCRRMARYPENAYRYIKEYRAENRALQSRVKELEEQLAKIQAKA